MKRRIFFFFWMFCAIISYGQEEKQSKTKKAWRGLINDLTAVQNDTLVNVKSENVFLPFQGMIIRHVAMEQVGFEISLYDSAKKTRKAIVNIGNALHTDSRPKTIQENLFIQPGSRLNAFKLADNERYLRNLPFIVDARIQVLPIAGTDSVDLVIVTRDAFSLGFSGYPSDIDKGKIRIYDNNLMGMGQRLQYGGEWDGSQDPVYRNELLYRKTSAFGSLINVALFYTQINSGRSLGTESEYAYGVNLNRQLLSPYMRLAGAYDWSTNWSKNIDSKVDTVYRNYSYYLNDFWIGYNIGVKKELENRSRHFIAIRWFNQEFNKFPTQTSEIDNEIYNNRDGLLGKFTFYNKDFYRTRYIFGFGITEDVQYGSEVSFLLGSVRKLGIRRPYYGFEADKVFANAKGDLVGLTLNLSTYSHDGALEDAAFVTNFRFFTRLYSVGSRLKIREFVNVSYSQVFNNVDSAALRIYGRYGINDLNSKLTGTKRYNLQSQTVFFTNWNLLGFRFAGVAYLEMASLANDRENLLQTQPFFGIGLGIRSRNENLSFGTMEAKFQFYPRTPNDVDSFRFTFSTNLRTRNTGILVSPPTLINYNE